MTNHIRVRFAPSPTGYLHVGGARTALFNWLFARHFGGTFVLRIEDTDFSRSSDEMVEGILNGMRWLGLEWDEGPFFQSRRLERYRDMAQTLLDGGHAYRCFCAPENPSSRRNAQSAAGTVVSSCDRRCLSLTRAESEAKARAGHPFATRYKVPPGNTSFTDIVFGPIEVDNSQIEDFVLLRSDGIPTYHLGVVVDDLDMAITHVIRGADHISNTPKQILLYRAIGKNLPEFAHLPLILGPDKQRLSKRHGATSVTAYAEMGFLPEAFFNFLALLGWAPGGDRELLSKRELIELFTLAGVGKANAVFGLEKLDWFNAQYLQKLPADELVDMASECLFARAIWQKSEPELSREELAAAVELLRPRLRKPADFAATFKSYFTDRFDYDPAAVEKFLRQPGLVPVLKNLRTEYEADTHLTLESAERRLRAAAGAAGIKAGTLINALRVGLTGQGVAPGLFEVMITLGQKRVLTRMRRLEDYLSRIGQ